MRNIRYIFMRELSGYFATPVAYVFLVIFLGLVFIDGRLVKGWRRAPA